MKTAQRTLTYSRKPVLRHLAEKSGGLPDLNAAIETGQRNFRKPSPSASASPIISQATQNVGLSLYEMLGMAELMRVAYEKGDLASVQDRLALLRADADSLSSSLSKILALTRIERESPDTACVDFDVVALLFDIAEATRAMLGDKPVTVMDVSCASPVVIHSDPAKIQQIMMGLMSNAAQFTERGRIALILSKDNDEIKLTVADNGRGMTQEQICSALEPSEHGHDGELNGHTTSGLGLKIVKAFVKQLHGSLSIASKTGEGTIVAVSLPLKSIH